MAKLEQLLRSSVKACLAAGPLPVLIQSLRSRRCLSVLTYHSVVKKPLPFYDWSFLDAAVFRQQIEYLKKYFTVLPLSQAFDLLKRDALDGPTAVITFDDGFQNNFDVAFPILREFQAPSTIFLATDLIGSDRTVWFTRLLLALQATPCKNLQWNGGDYPLNGQAQLVESSAHLQAALKKFPATRLEDELTRIELFLSGTSNPKVPKDSPFRMLDQAAIANMVDSRLVEFGAHTCGHTILSRLTPSEKSAQISDSVLRVEELTGQKCLSFAYPNGAPSDFDSESQHLLQAAGIRAALTMVPGPNRPTTEALEIHRYPIGADTTFSRFRLMVHNVA